MKALKLAFQSRFMAASLVLLPNIKIDPSQFVGPAAELPPVESVVRLDRVREMFRANGASELPTENSSDLRRFILAAVVANLKDGRRDLALTIARAVIEEGNRQNLDPFFLLAVIKTESEFATDVIGRHGEIGLMQILPRTASEIASRLGLEEPVDLRDPAVNVRVGAAFLAELRRKFPNSTNRFVGAYNMGVGHVRRLIALNAEPKLYPDKVFGHYRSFFTAFAR